MHSVFKYKLIPDITLDLPKGAEVLTVASQGEDIFLWAKVDPTAETEKRRFLGFGTGHDIPDRIETSYIGTVFLGSLVFHIFEDVTQ